MGIRKKLVELFYDNNVRCDQKIEGLADDVMDIIANGVTVQELNGCKYCRTALYTESPFTIITPMGGEVKTQFNFCPNCGRRLPQSPKDFLADYLVDKGVTAQEWKPISEPPKRKDTYIVCTDNDGVLLGHWYGTHWNAGGRANKHLAYWMEKPQPAEGE